MTPIATIDSSGFHLDSTGIVNSSPQACVRRLEQWRQVVARVDLSRFPMKMDVGVQASAEWTPIPVAVIVASVPDRENLHVEAKVTFTRQLPEFAGTRHALLWLRDFAIETITHELDECFLVDGDRVFDPHSPLAVRRGA